MALPEFSRDSGAHAIFESVTIAQFYHCKHASLYSCVACVTIYHFLYIYRHTFVHTTFPLEQWQVLQSSSHLAPSGVACPLTEHGFLVTVLNTTAALDICHK